MDKIEKENKKSSSELYMRGLYGGLRLISCVCVYMCFKLQSQYETRNNPQVYNEKCMLQLLYKN